MTTQTAKQNDAEVIIVGAGPVGLVLALLLAKQKRKVLVLERWEEHYPLPRAVAIAHEPLRTLVSVGFNKPELLERWGQDGQKFTFQDATGQTLIETTYERWAESGYAPMHAFSQPEIEAELNRLALAEPNITLRRSVEVVGVKDNGDNVTVEIADWDSIAMKIVGEGLPSVQGAIVVGCDGANSIVRKEMGHELIDYGFTRDWFVVDIDLKPGAPELPYATQHVDPKRPTTLISGGPGHRRFEFMLLEEDPTELVSDEGAWKLLGEWEITPENATFVRQARYRFVARLLENWARGNLLLAGDAAHQMPPFLGQGFNSGIRDAANLAWRIEDYLSKRSSAATFSDYSAERYAQVKEVIDETVRAAGIICETNPERARVRNEKFLAKKRVVPGLTTWVIKNGTLREGDALAGRLAFQAPEDGVGLQRELDSMRNGGPLLLLAPGIDSGVIDESVRSEWQELGGQVVGFDSAGLQNNHEAYAEWFDEEQVVAILMRPDFYIYGSAKESAEIAALLREFINHNKQQS